MVEVVVDQLPVWVELVLVPAPSVCLVHYCFVIAGLVAVVFLVVPLESAICHEVSVRIHHCRSCFLSNSL